MISKTLKDNPLSAHLTQLGLTLGMLVLGGQWALGQIDTAQKKADSAYVEAAQVRATVANIDKNLDRLMQAAGVAPVKETPPPRAVVIFYEIAPGDTISGVKVIGDTVYVPRVKKVIPGVPD
jgi:hypothetical protein